MTSPGEHKDASYWRGFSDGWVERSKWAAEEARDPPYWRLPPEVWDEVRRTLIMRYALRRRHA